MSSVLVMNLRNGLRPGAKLPVLEQGWSLKLCPMKPDQALPVVGLRPNDGMFGGVHD